MNFLLILSLLVLVTGLARCHPGYTRSDNLSKSAEVAETTPIKAWIPDDAGIPLTDALETLPVKTRSKRLSDQRRAELETLKALSRMILISCKQLDPKKIGRR
ncbi:uncharacterized protein [Prorops nasuta]|uniref:uncharacterized protein n=1 Tax=Prorops nasuta TaxID=863751 RepID=UPI0034CF226D